MAVAVLWWAFYVVALVASVATFGDASEECVYSPEPNSPLTILTKNPVPPRIGEVFTMEISLSPRRGNYHDAVVAINISFGHVLDISRTCEIVGNVDAKNRQGLGYYFECRVETNLRKGEVFSTRIIVVLLPDVPVPPSMRAYAAVLLPGDTYEEPSHYMRHDIQLNPGQGKVARIIETVPPMNRITFNSSVELVGENMFDMPARIMLGPYVLRVIQHVDPEIRKTRALVRLPLRPTNIRLDCPKASEHSVRTAIHTAQPSYEDGLFAAAMYTPDNTVPLNDVYCSVRPHTWPPSWFAFTMQRNVIVAPNLGRINISVEGVPLTSCRGLVAGCSNRVELFIPETGPVYLAEMLSAYVRVTSGIVVTSFLRQSIMPSPTEESVFVHHFAALLSVPPTMRGVGEVIASVPIVGLHRRWESGAQLPIITPHFAVDLSPQDSYRLLLTLTVLNGTTLVQPVLLVSVQDAVVPVHWKVGTDRNCAAPPSATAVATGSATRCTVGDVHRGKYRKNVTFSVQVEVADYFADPLSVSVHASALNSDKVVNVATVLQRYAAETSGTGENNAEGWEPVPDEEEYYFEPDEKEVPPGAYKRVAPSTTATMQPHQESRLSLNSVPVQSSKAEDKTDEPASRISTAYIFCLLPFWGLLVAWALLCEEFSGLLFVQKKKTPSPSPQKELKDPKVGTRSPPSTKRKEKGGLVSPSPNEASLMAFVAALSAHFCCSHLWIAALIGPLIPHSRSASHLAVSQSKVEKVLSLSWFATCWLGGAASAALMCATTVTLQEGMLGDGGVLAAVAASPLVTIGSRHFLLPLLHGHSRAALVVLLASVTSLVGVCILSLTMWDSFKQSQFWRMLVVAYVVDACCSQVVLGIVAAVRGDS